MGGEGSGGYNKKSAETKLLEGNPGHRRIQEESATRLPSKKPSCPKTLDALAKKIWRETVREMDKAGTIALVDRYLLASYCSACSVYLRAQEVLDTQGLTQLAPRQPLATLAEKIDPQAVRHETRPEVKIAHEARQQIRALGAELGITPKARGFIRPGQPLPKEPEDQIDEVLNTNRRN